MRSLTCLTFLCCVLLQFFAVSCKQEQPPPTPTPRTVASSSPLVALTPTEYNNTIRDLFGMPQDVGKWPALNALLDPKKGGGSTNWPWAFPPERGVDQFEGMVAGQIASSYKTEQLQKAASYYAALALHSKIFFACEGWDKLAADKQKSCGWASIQRFAQRAWRRPITKPEQARLAAFWESLWKGSQPEDAVKLAVAGILQTPAFLYRVEQGNSAKKEANAVPLTSWELASRLSYFLWDSMPDATLYAAAAAGKFETSAQIEAQARRMLKDPRARKAVVHFHNQLLGMQKIHKINPSRLIYGTLFGFTPRAPGPKAENDQLWPQQIMSLRHSLAREVELFVERTVFDGAGTLKALFTDNHGYMSSHTKPLYGDKAKELPGPKVQVSGSSAGSVAAYGVGFSFTLSPAEFPKDQRAGLLTMPGVLALYAHPVHPSPILRGKFVLERLACIHLGAPPPAAFGKEPKDTLDAEGTNRERTEQLSKPATCIGCHKFLNPPGFALENFDALGGWRTKDNGKDVNASVTIKLGDDTFNTTGGVDFAKQLATSNVLRNCYTLRWARYATGVQLKADHPGVVALQAGFRKNDKIQNLLIAIVTSDLFRYRNAGETTP